MTTGETERALRALTCTNCANKVPLRANGRHVCDCGDSGCCTDTRPCTSKHAELLPLFNAGIAGAYAAAAKLCDAYGRESNRFAQEYACETADEIAARIRALTPADARQHVLPCDPNDQVSETQFQKVIWDAIASVLGPKGQILANSLQEKLTIGIRDYLRWNCERAKAHRGEK